MTNTTITQGSVLTTTTTLDGSIDWTAQYIEPGTRVYCDGQEGRAYPDRRVGSRWDRVSYRFVTPSIFPGRTRTDIMHRSQMRVIP